MPWILRAATKIANSPCPTPSRPLFKFEMTADAANHNWQVLESFNLNLAAAIEAQGDSPIGYGSEFRQPDILEPLLFRHPRWPKLRQRLLNGSDFHLEELPETERTHDLQEALERGNHKSARSRKELLITLVSDDVVNGFTIPLPSNKIHLLPRAAIAPYGIAQQNTIDETGRIIPKDRLTHDMSFRFSSGKSFNDRTDLDLFDPVQFGDTLRRIIHYIIDLRRRHPTTPILVAKFDWKAAYRRAHFKAETASEAITTIDEMAFLALRFTFGGAACPSEWGLYSETACDLANDLIRCKEWNPSVLCSPHQHKMPNPVRFDASVPFAQALPMSVLKMLLLMSSRVIFIYPMIV